MKHGDNHHYKSRHQHHGYCVQTDNGTQRFKECAVIHNHLCRCRPAGGTLKPAALLLKSQQLLLCRRCVDKRLQIKLSIVNGKLTIKLSLSFYLLESPSDRRKKAAHKGG